MDRQINSVEMEQRKGRRLVLFPLPLQGHINPMFDLANILHSRGFSITIIHTTFNSPNPSNYPHFTFRIISEDLPENNRCTKDLIAFVSMLNAICGRPFRDCLADLLSDTSEEPIACLISDAILYFTQDVANELKVPRMVLRTGAASSFCVFSSFPLLREKGYLPIQDSQLEEPIVELPPLRVKDLPVIHTNDPEDLYNVVVGMVEQSKASNGMIWNTFEELEGTSLATLHQKLGVPLFPIGPFHKCFAVTSSTTSSSLLTHDQSCISWLDKQDPKSVIYVSFGSLASISETQFLEIAWGLANSNQPFLWVVRQGLVHGSNWVEPLPNGFLETLGGKGHIVKWAPQQQVLAHSSVGAFWTHNGWNSTLESICEGVPMVCMPCFTDQKVNARYVSEVWGIGLQLEKGLERGEIERTIKRLMVDKDGENIRERMLNLKEKSNLCLSESGSSKQALDSLVHHILSLESLTFHTQ